MVMANRHGLTVRVADGRRIRRDTMLVRRAHDAHPCRAPEFEPLSTCFSIAERAAGGRRGCQGCLFWFALWNRRKAVNAGHRTRVPVPRTFNDRSRQP